MVLGPVIGAFGEMSDDFKHIADAVATELANEHCSYYSDKKTKTVRSYFRNQLYRSWGLAAVDCQPTADGHAFYSTAGAW